MLRIQTVVEKIIKKHSGVSEALEKFYNDDEFELTVKREHFQDFRVSKAGSYLLVGYYNKQNGDIISDPIFAFEIINGEWHIIRIEQWCGDTIVGTVEEGKYSYDPSRLKAAKSFASDCAKEWTFYYL